MAANETMGAGGSSTTRNLSYSYDGLARLITETEQTSGASGPTVRGYSYDGVGNRQQLLLTIPGSGGGGVPGTTFSNQYGYDLADHMITQTAASVSTAGGTVTPLNSYGYSYDNNGSVISDTNSLSAIMTRTSYTYDTRNRMTNWQQSTTGSSGIGRSSWVYDGANTRVSSTFIGADNTNLNTNYVTDVASGLPTVVQEIRNGQSNNYLYGLGSPTPLYQEQVGNNAGAAWYHSDGIGSVRALTDGTSGALLNGYGYSAFGSTSQTMGSSTITNTHGFGGEQQDPTGLYYNRGRYYNANTGRFNSRDSYAGSGYNPVSQNRFVYAGNNPTRYTDPSGNYYTENDGGGSGGQKVVVGPRGVRDTSVAPSSEGINNVAVAIGIIGGTNSGSKLPLDGGRYGEIKKSRGGSSGGEIHHMPADSTSPLSRNDGPAIWMEKADHKATASYGFQPGAKDYRAITKSIIDEGQSFYNAAKLAKDSQAYDTATDLYKKAFDKFEDAIGRDVEDVLTKYGTKYAKGISQMFDSLPSLVNKNGEYDPEAAARAYYEPESLPKIAINGESFEGMMKKVAGPLELLAVLDGLWNVAKTWTNYDQHTPIKVIEVPIVPLLGCRMENVGEVCRA